MDALHGALTFFLAAAIISLVAGRLHLPYTIALVIVGLAAGYWHVAQLTLSPQILLFALILPLLFDGGLHLPIVNLLRFGWLIGTLAVFGTLIAAAAISAAALFLWHVPLRGALLLGAIASAIDPVSVIALVREAGLDRRLGTILEGEAVFNDAVAIVLFTLAAGPDLEGWTALGRFVWLLGGGTLIGAALGLVVGAGLSRIRQHLVEVLASFALAVAAYLAADSVGGSGVIAVVAAGIVLGNLCPRVLTQMGEQTLRSVWEVITFLANSALFLAIGLAIPWPPLAHLAGPILIIAATALLARAAAVYGFVAAGARIFGAVPRSWEHILVWGSLRGGVALALVLQLPTTLPGRDDIVAGVYGLVIFTLLVQGLSMQSLIRRLGLLISSLPPAPSSAAT